MKHITPMRFLAGVLLVALFFGIYGSYAAWSNMRAEAAKKAEEAAVKAEQKKAVKPPSKRGH